MNRGTKIILLAVCGAIALAAIFYFIFLPLFVAKTPEGAGPDANLPASGLSNAPSAAAAGTENNPPPPKEVSPVVDQVSAARSVTRTFAERLGTYTSDNGLVNLEDLRSISTPAVWKYVDGEYRKSVIAGMPKTGYYSVTATVMNANVVAVSETEANATVLMQKVESGAVSATSYPVLELKLRKAEGGWAVSWLEWKI